MRCLGLVADLSVCRQFRSDALAGRTESSVLTLRPEFGLQERTSHGLSFCTALPLVAHDGCIHEGCTAWHRRGLRSGSARSGLHRPAATADRLSLQPVQVVRTLLREDDVPDVCAIADSDVKVTQRGSVWRSEVRVRAATVRDATATPSAGCFGARRADSAAPSRAEPRQLSVSLLPSREDGRLGAGRGKEQCAQMVGVHFNITESYTPTFDRMIRSGLALPCVRACGSFATHGPIRLPLPRCV